MSLDRPIPIRLPAWLAWSLLLVIAVTVLSWELGDYRTLGTHEAVAVVPAREMSVSGDWIVPRYAGEPRLQKPPLVYWLIAANGRLAGSFTESVTRWHSAFAALALMALMSVWAWRWYGREAAFGAGLMQAVSVWCVDYGRRAEVDMVLCLLIASALFLIAPLSREESPARRRVRWFAVHGLLGLSWLAKFHYGVAMVLGPAFVFWIWQRHWKRFADLFNPAGLLVLAACVSVWPWLVASQLPEAWSVWTAETVGRAAGRMGYSPWWKYCPLLVLFTLPWPRDIVLAIPHSAARAWRHADERERFVWSWLLADLAIAWASPIKHTNYVLGALPAVTLLGCQAFARLTAQVHRRVFRVPTPLIWCATAGTCAVGAGLFWGVASRWPAAQLALRISAVALTAGLLTACWAMRRRQFSMAGWTALLTTTACYLMIVGPVWRAEDDRGPQAQFARTLRRDVLGDQPVYVFGVRNVLPNLNPIAFELDEPVRRADTLDNLECRLAEQGSLAVVTETRRLPELARIAHVRMLAQMTEAEPPRPKFPPLVCVRLQTLSQPRRPLRRRRQQSLTPRHRPPAAGSPRPAPASQRLALRSQTSFRPPPPARQRHHREAHDG